MDKSTLREVEQVLGYHFRNPSYVYKAFTHSSSTEDRLRCNERLEFFGDSVLAIVICHRIFERFPEYFEGDLTKIKSMLVSRKTCAKISNALGLTKYVKVGKGMSHTRAMSGSISAGIFEAIVAAIYLDGGFESASTFILKQFDPLIENANAAQHHENFKSVMQQHAQQNFGVTPVYTLLDEKGPDHNKCFETAVVIGERHFPSAWGITKKEAEQCAARVALVELGILEPEKDQPNQ